MITAQVGLILVVPTIVTPLVSAALISAVHIQLRLIEEPYPSRVHGAAWTRYSARTGRRLPRPHFRVAGELMPGSPDRSG